MLRKIVFAPGEFYHLYNRGVDHRIIFNDDHDRNRFVALCYLANSPSPINIRDHFNKGRSFVEIFELPRNQTLIDIGAWCLMPNHFHLLVKETSENGITTFMRKLLTGYSSYFNKRNKRSGTLFENRFKAKHANEDRYLEYLFSYIHLNPIKIVTPKWREVGVDKKSYSFIKDYEYSSFKDYCDEGRPQGRILAPNSFPKYFTAGDDFKYFTSNWLNFESTMDSQIHLQP